MLFHILAIGKNSNKHTIAFPRDFDSVLDEYKNDKSFDTIFIYQYDNEKVNAPTFRRLFKRLSDNSWLAIYDETL